MESCAITVTRGVSSEIVIVLSGLMSSAIRGVVTNASAETVAEPVIVMLPNPRSCPIEPDVVAEELDWPPTLLCKVTAPATVEDAVTTESASLTIVLLADTFVEPVILTEDS
jgi:hypothetical protein